MSSYCLLVAVLSLTIPQTPSQGKSPQYFIGRVTFTGSPDKGTDKILRATSASIEEGSVYTAERLNSAIQAINKLGMFEKVTRSDCRVTRSKTNPEAVDIEVKLKAKVAPSGPSR